MILTEIQNYLQNKILRNGWKITTTDVDQKKGKKQFNKNKFTIKFDYINISFIDEKGCVLFAKINPDIHELSRIYKI